MIGKPKEFEGVGRVASSFPTWCVRLKSIFRKEQFLPRLAQFYLREDTNESLKWFGNPQGTFPVAVEGDRCPFGKNERACTFVTKFLKYQ